MSSQRSETTTSSNRRRAAGDETSTNNQPPPPESSESLINNNTTNLLPNIDADTAFFGGTDVDGDDDDNVLHQALQEEDYYARLNVNKNATDDEISNAYRRLARILHPDKHSAREQQDSSTSASLKAIAEQAFNRIREAYDVLSDPVRRAIFDACGVEGLQQHALSSPSTADSIWQMEPYSKQDSSSKTGNKSSEEIKEMFESMRAGRREQSMIEQTTPHHEVTVSLDATNLWDRSASKPPLSSFIPNAEIVFMQSTQLISAQWPPVDRLQFFSTIQYEKGAGNGIIGAEISRPLFNNQFTGELKVLTGPGRGLVNHLKLSKRWGSKRTISFGAFSSITGYGISRPVLEASINQSLSDQLFGRLSIRQSGGRQSTVNTGLDYTTEKLGTVSASVDVGFRHTSCTLGWRYTFPGIHEQRVHARFTLSDRGEYNIEYGLRRKATKITRIGSSIDISSRTGVRLRLNIQRFSQVYNIPIQLSHEIDYGVIFYATVIPLALYYVCTNDFLLPKWRSVIADKIRLQLQARRSQAEQRRREAIEYRQLMQSKYDELVERESRAGGLVITHAVYGPVPTLARLVREGHVPFVSPLLMVAALPDASSTNLASSFIGGEQLPPASGYSRDAAASAANSAVRISVSATTTTTAATSSTDEADFVNGLDKLLDVTVALQCLVDVKTRSLQLTSHSKSNLPGFYDCAPAERKSLVINYIFGGKKHFLIADDSTGVYLPTSTHRVNPVI